MVTTNMQSNSGQQSVIEKMTGLKHGNSICYSGYREGQNPRLGTFPSYEEVKEDLLLLADNWSFLRLYDCSKHAETVLNVIQKEQLSFHIMLGVDMAAEVSNPHCPWGAHFSDEILAKNKIHNSEQIDQLINLAAQYPKVVFSVSVGNEASVEWTDHMVPVESLINYVQRIKSNIIQPVTFCENYVPWSSKLVPLAAELDFISIHTYPVWEYQNIDEALEYTKKNFYEVLNCYPDKPIVITEAGWTTQSNGHGIDVWNASEELQATYINQLLEWTTEERILTFVFEAFDEPWKGSDDLQEPEKHWGLFKVDRKPKQVVQQIHS
jgi:exo-beta-1,3-glucanase (GH17 family)